MDLLGRSAFAIGCCLVALLSLASPAESQESERVLRFRFVPASRAQIAIWIESNDGTYQGTIMLTEATVRRGIGNRPGALQMNSGYRWPYGRREGVLPVWGYARAEASGAEPFRRVIFQNRTSEGFASRTSVDASVDDYFCLSFTHQSQEEALDATSCASPNKFNSDKGRYITATDLADGYAEPFEEDGAGTMRPLSELSIYPPRRDVTQCTASMNCSDHDDVDFFAADVARIMPNIDAISMATPAGNLETFLQYTVPAGWPDGDYLAWIEINVEGDHNATYSAEAYPTPDDPSNAWDVWAKTYGYPYRGQPSVVFRVPFTLDSAGGSYSAVDAYGYGALQGEDGDVRPIDETMSASGGSGADRLQRMADGARVVLDVVPVNVCGGENPPPECDEECDEETPCEEGFVCGTESTCVGLCDVAMAPGQVQHMALEPVPDEKNSHHWASLSFVVPSSPRDIARYDVRVNTRPITDVASFEAARPANAASLDSMALAIPTNGSVGDPVAVEMGQLTPETHYYVGIRAVDVCNAAGEITVAEVVTTEINFTTVSPCFIATAAHGSPLADEVATLRRFRDRHLMPNPVGRLLVDTYYEVGPLAASVIRERPWMRDAVVTLLRPVVAVAGWLE